MSALYWFALIVGGGFLAASMLGEFLNAQADTDLAADTGEHGHGDAFRVLSLRNITYFCFSFGAAGLGLQFLSSLSPVVVGVVATVVGLLATGVSAWLLRYVSQNASGEQESEESFVGCAGRVTLPFAADGSGRVVVRRGVREYELRARRFERAGETLRVGSEIVVVEMTGGTALVSPVDESVSLLS